MTRILLLTAVSAFALAACDPAPRVHPSPVPAPPAEAAVVAPVVAEVLPVPPATADGPDFLARNGAAPGVVTTASGLQYFIVKSGPASEPHPRPGDTVTFDYEGKLLNGETFDSSYAEGKPLTGEVTKFVPGFSEALQLMRPGDEWVVWIPPALGYGAKAVGPIPANSTLRFKLALHSVTHG